MPTLATLTAAQSRIDDGVPQPGDHVCAQRLEVLLQAAAERSMAIQSLRDLDRWRDWHAEACDDDENCKHYEIRED